MPLNKETKPNPTINQQKVILKRYKKQKLLNGNRLEKELSELKIWKIFTFLKGVYPYRGLWHPG